MSEKLKIKYVFQKHHGLTTLTRDDTRSTRREIRDFLDDLSTYSVDIMKLCSQNFNMPDRNMILNIALLIINNENIVTELVRTRKVPVKLIANVTGLSVERIDDYREYIVAYMLLFGYSKYSTISRNLSIGTTMDGKEYGDEKQRGLFIKELPGTAVILTAQGDFRYLDIPSDSSVGEIVTGKESVFSPKRVIKLGVIATLIVSLIFIFSFLLMQPVKILHFIGGDSHVELSYNRIGRLIEAKGMNSSGNKVTSNVVFSNKKFDTSLAEIIKNGVGSKEMNPRDMSIVIISGDFSKDLFNKPELINTLKYYGITLKINLKNGNALFLD